ncbi:unnamed protein product [Pieris macdunnoughi]|uniref:RRM domain-containing protein n=1 Tax=Pieris macdunnoughi TaxID=345717 RepID=A0A821M8M2_9NEOP|nr:unnamed protein product [Pieris macdunnoughi]
MCTPDLPKEFKKSSEVLPFSKYGVSSLEEFKLAEEQVQHLEWLKKAGLTNEEVKLYQDNEAGLLEQQSKSESSILKQKLQLLYRKINEFQENKDGSDKNEDPVPSTSTNSESNQKNTINFYPEGHPMNELKKIEESLFGHLRNDDILPITKRRKILRRLDRKKERILSQQKELHIDPIPCSSKAKLGSLWDVKDIPDRLKEPPSKRPLIGPKKQTMYTVKDNKIVRLEQESQEEFRAVDIVLPQNQAEEQLLEGTKMSLDDIKSIERFKDYKPGIPSKVLYLKNIAPSVSEEQISLLFNQFQLENGGPIDVHLLSGRMRGQAFVTFRSEDLAIQALDEVNGTIMSGRPIIAEFGRNSNRVQNER